jgi:hypothetical protein
MEADTPKRSATAPTFSASPTFLGERAAFVLRSVVLGCELEEALDNGPLSIAARSVIVEPKRLRYRGSVGARVGGRVIRPTL